MTGGTSFLASIPARIAAYGLHERDLRAVAVAVGSWLFPGF
jgi:hypothetical protein